MKKLAIDYSDMTADDLAEMEYNDLPPQRERMAQHEREAALAELAELFGEAMAIDTDISTAEH